MNIREAIRALNDMTIVYSIQGTVIEVDEAQRTCTVRPVNGDADLYDVRLQATPGVNNVGMLAIPKVNSFVIVTMLNEATGIVSMFSEVERVDLVGSEENLQPLVKGESLNDNLDDLTDKIADLANDLATFASTQAAASTGALAPLAPGFTTLVTAASALAAAATALKANYANHISLKASTE